MKSFFALITLILFNYSFGYSQVKEEIKIPEGIRYNYCDNKTIENAKRLIRENLANDKTFTLTQSMLIVGPQLWTRFKNIKRLNTIEGGNVTFHLDNIELSGKMTQSEADAKKVWDEFRKEVKGAYTIRKLNEQELRYYWVVISFDIDEPLLVVETKEHRYILNLLKDNLKLMWLDEAPVSKGLKMYENGQEVKTVSKGDKETKLEKLILLNNDDELRANTTVEDISLITEKISKIFDELFKNATKEGKIIIHVELRSKDNLIEFAVKDNIDTAIMKEFERRVKLETFPNSKKSPVGFQLLYKVNSYNDTE